jgi:hypothetical protein
MNAAALCEVQRQSHRILFGSIGFPRFSKGVVFLGFVQKESPKGAFAFGLVIDWNFENRDIVSKDANFGNIGRPKDQA